MRIHVTNRQNRPKRLTGGAVTHIVGELRKLEARGWLSRQGSRTFIKCPFHGNGQEKTPSCLVTTRVDSQYEIGSFRCMGCGEAGGWNQLAEALGLEQVGVDANVAKTVLQYDPEFFNKLLRERYTSFAGTLKELGLTNPRPVPDDMVWRSIPASLLNRLKVCLVDGAEGESLFMPSYINENMVGGIRALMNDPGDKSIVKYKNSPGVWSRAKGLYPYDLCSSMLDKFEKKYGFRGLALVEGARDSLCLCAEGIPTVGLLGTQSWCAGKLDNILDLDPDFCLIVMDGDGAGREAEQKIWEAMKRLVPSRRMNLSRFNKEVSAELGKETEVDPGNALPWVIEEIWQQLHKRKSQRS